MMNARVFLFFFLFSSHNLHEGCFMHTIDWGWVKWVEKAVTECTEVACKETFATLQSAMFILR